MSADQIAEIAPAIHVVLTGEKNTCATFSVAATPDCWVQFTDGTVNASYPLADEPSSLISQMGNASLESWEPGQYLTVKLALVDVRPISKWIDQYFEQVLAAPKDYSLDVSIELL